MTGNKRKSSTKSTTKITTEITREVLAKRKRNKKIESGQGKRSTRNKNKRSIIERTESPTIGRKNTRKKKSEIDKEID